MASSALTRAIQGQSQRRERSEKRHLLTDLLRNDQILRKKGTEAAGSGEYDSHYPGKGVYECAGQFRRSLELRDVASLRHRQLWLLEI